MRHCPALPARTRGWHTPPSSYGRNRPAVAKGVCRGLRPVPPANSRPGAAAPPPGGLPVATPPCGEPRGPVRHWRPGRRRVWYLRSATRPTGTIGPGAPAGPATLSRGMRSTRLQDLQLIGAERRNGRDGNGSCRGCGLLSASGPWVGLPPRLRGKWPESSASPPARRRAEGHARDRSSARPARSGGTRAVTSGRLPLRRRGRAIS